MWWADNYENITIHWKITVVLLTGFRRKGIKIVGEGVVLKEMERLGLWR